MKKLFFLLLLLPVFFSCKRESNNDTAPIKVHRDSVTLSAHTAYIAIINEEGDTTKSEVVDITNE